MRGRDTPPSQTDAISDDADCMVALGEALRVAARDGEQRERLAQALALSEQKGNMDAATRARNVARRLAFSANGTHVDGKCAGSSAPGRYLSFDAANDVVRPPNRRHRFAVKGQRVADGRRARLRRFLLCRIGGSLPRSIDELPRSRPPSAGRAPGRGGRSLE